MGGTWEERFFLSKDLGQILNDWEFDANGIAARWIQGDDGHPKVQLRVNLGVLQMEAKGRPDGHQPEGCSSLLEYYLHLEEQQDEAQPLELGPEACAELQQEALQFYYRYLAFYALGYLDGVIEDTSHNLDLLDLVSQYATDDDLAWQFLQFFPYVRMMNARARAEKLIKHEDVEMALRTIEDAIADIDAFGLEYSDDSSVDASQERAILDDLRRRIASRKPKSEEERLRDELRDAIRSEDYEHAAEVRDALQKLGLPRMSLNGMEPMP